MTVASAVPEPAPAAATPVVVAQPRPAPVPARAAPPPAEAPLTAPDKSPGPGGGALLAQASRALRDGSLVRAVELSREAVNASPGNADAWLTLGAAYQATGNAAAAREAYRSCIEKAKTANVGECRVLAGP
jgi:cytochrome c-type biogenesis protein CcmH/NrfG